MMPPRAGPAAAPREFILPIYTSFRLHSAPDSHCVEITNHTFSATHIVWKSTEFTSAADDPSVSQSVFTITEKAPTRVPAAIIKGDGRL